MQFEFALAFALFIFIYCPFVVFFGCLQHCKLCKLLSSYSLDSNPNNNKKTHTATTITIKTTTTATANGSRPQTMLVSQLAGQLVGQLVWSYWGRTGSCFLGIAKETLRERDSESVREGENKGNCGLRFNETEITKLIRTNGI